MSSSGETVIIWRPAAGFSLFFAGVGSLGAFVFDGEFSKSIDISSPEVAKRVILVLSASFSVWTRTSQSVVLLASIASFCEK